MNRFRTDNTDGYDAAELAELNEAFDELTGDGAIDDTSFFDHVSETLLFAYDQGYRGENLIRKCWAVGI